MRAAVSLTMALCASLAAAAALAQPAPSAAPQVAVTNVPANLNITPRRLTFDQSRRSATVFIFNQGGEPATVDITLIDRVMLPDGQIVSAEEAGKTADRKPVVDRLKSAHDMVQIAPRRVQLEPGKGQTIRLRIGNVPEGAPTEYRTHLTVTTIPPADAGVTAEEAAKAAASDRLSFRISTVYGLSIPVIIRSGALDAQAAIQNARLETETVSLDGRAPAKPTPMAVFDLVRTGATSLYGNLEVRSAGEKRGDAIGVARNVGVYTEIDRRTLRIPLSRAPKPGEKLEVTFTDDDTSPGKVLAKSML